MSVSVSQMYLEPHVAIQITSSVIYSVILIYLLYIISKKIIHTKWNDITDCSLLALQIYGFIEGVLWNIYKITFDNTIYHALQAIDCLYYIGLVIRTNSVSSRSANFKKVKTNYRNEWKVLQLCTVGYFDCRGCINWRGGIWANHRYWYLGGKELLI